jgi:hypothetical protein
MAQTPQPKGGRSITLRAPRVAHAREMLAQPVPMGPWRFLKRDALPKRAEIVEWLTNGPPVIARISIANLAPQIAEIFAWGSGAKDDDGKPMVRHWAATPELLTLAHFTDLDIDAAWVGTGYGPPMPVPAAVDPARATPTAHASISFGLVSEAIWGAACRRAPAALVRAASGYGGKGGRHGGGGGGASGGGKRPSLGVAFRALWIRAADRAAMFRAAAGLRSQGWAVSGYGAGGVTVCALPEALAEVVRDDLAEGLAPAPGVAARFGLPAGPTNAGWGGEPMAAADARLRASGQGGLLLKLDAVPFLPPARRAALLAELAKGEGRGRAERERREGRRDGRSRWRPEGRGTGRAEAD